MMVEQNTLMVAHNTLMVEQNTLMVEQNILIVAPFTTDTRMFLFLFFPHLCVLSSFSVSDYWLVKSFYPFYSFY